VKNSNQMDKSEATRKQLIDAGFVVEENRVLTVPVDEITPLKDQPRMYFDPDELTALAGSIKTNGQAQPVLVIKFQQSLNGAKYELIDGERRWRAIKQAGLKTIRIIICQVKDFNQQHLLSLISNFNRIDHTHQEKIKAVIALRANLMSADQIAVAVGKKISWVLNYTSLARLHPDILAKLDPPTPERDRISFSAALRLSTLKTEVEQLKLFQQIEKERAQGTSPVVLNEMLRRLISEGKFLRLSLRGKKPPREKKASDDDKSFRALVPRVRALVMKLEDFQLTPTIYRYFQKHKRPATTAMEQIFREAAQILLRYADTTAEILTNTQQYRTRVEREA